jgi:hypothetical protein
MSRASSPFSPHSNFFPALIRSRYGLLVIGLLLFYLLVSGGYWQATAVGPQVQVPMFYDAHYLFPRPWTQAQEAPGVPSPFPVAFYGPNTITQLFLAGADNLALVTVWLAGAADTSVKISLSAEDGPASTGEIILTQGEAGGYYRFRIPVIENANGRLFRLTLSAPTASAARPVVTHAIGGDRLGGSISLNEYQRPGNLELYTYSRGWAGGWWLDALAEQLLPQLFRLRLQQYKPDPFKGTLFPILLLVTGGLTVVVLVLVWPSPSYFVRWGAISGLVLFLGWQLGDGRLLLPFLFQADSLSEGVPQPLLISLDDFRVVNDMTTVLWTGHRDPEARFVTTTVIDGLPVVRVPANSRLSYALDVPLNGRFRTGIAAQGEGELRLSVQFDNEVLAEEEVTAVSEFNAAAVTWLEVDMTDLAGRSGTLALVTRPKIGAPDGLWLMPQLHSLTDWIQLSLPTAAIPINEIQFGKAVALAGYAVDPVDPQPGQLVTITLYWQALKTSKYPAAVFVHVLSPTGEMLAQHDSQPVLNSYPLPNWQPGTIIADPHPLIWPHDSSQQYHLGLGLYDPQSLVRWPVMDATGTNLPDDQLLLPLPGQP